MHLPLPTPTILKSRPSPVDELLEIDQSWFVPLPHVQSWTFVPLAVYSLNTSRHLPVAACLIW